MNIYIPFTYLIGWSAQNKYYYGVRHKKGCSPNELWTIYFTSSKVVKKFRELHGEPDIIQIRQCFYDRDSAINWEHKTLKRIVGNRHKYLNQNYHTKHSYHRLFNHGKEAKNKISAYMKGRPKSEKQKAKMSASRKKYWENTSRENIIKQNKNRLLTESTRKKMSSSAKNRITDEFKDAQSKRMSILVCRISDKKVMNVGNFFRYLN